MPSLRESFPAMARAELEDLHSIQNTYREEVTRIFSRFATRGAREKAISQAQAVALGDFTPLTEGEAEVSARNIASQVNRAWDLWVMKAQGKV